LAPKYGKGGLAVESKEEQQRKNQEDIVQIIIIVVGLVIVLLSCAAFPPGPPIQMYNVEGDGSISEAGEVKAKEEEESDEDDWLAPSNVPGDVSSDVVSEAEPFSAIASSAENGGQEVLVEKSIDINRASQDELDKLPGIGPVLAERIVEYREENGGFIDIEELKSVEGIGDKTFEKIQDYIIAG